jgi:N-methylhydantoinase B
VAVGWRFFLKHQMFDRLAARVADNDAPAGADIVATLFDELVAQYPALSAQRKAPGLAVRARGGPEPYSPHAEAH